MRDRLINFLTAAPYNLNRGEAENLADDIRRINNPERADIERLIRNANQPQLPVAAAERIMEILTANQPQRRPAEEPELRPRTIHHFRPDWWLRAGVLIVLAAIGLGYYFGHMGYTKVAKSNDVTDLNTKVDNAVTASDASLRVLMAATGARINPTSSSGFDVSRLATTSALTDTERKLLSQGRKTRKLVEAKATDQDRKFAELARRVDNAATIQDLSGSEARVLAAIAKAQAEVSVEPALSQPLPAAP